MTIFAKSINTNHTINNADNVYTEDKLSILVDAHRPEFIIKLKSNPTTGYSWFLREYDSSLIMPVKRAYHQSTDNLIGAVGYELWTFRVKPAGFIVPQQTVIRMIYARPWQGNDSSTQLVFRITTK
ncbi:MAG: protease inhibitor I42 family protein [Gammaproteobacteria bacterium]|nr:protease inhibitor I42 family protein [Gammaproteobacteria bacterium]